MTVYRDPLPEEARLDEPRLIGFLPPERQTYWRQVTDDKHVSPRWMNHNPTELKAEVSYRQTEMICEAIDGLTDTLRASLPK